MVKSKNELNILIGIALILIGIIGVGKIVDILLVIFGGYLIYEAMKKH